MAPLDVIQAAAKMNKWSQIIAGAPAPENRRCSSTGLSLKVF